MKKLLAYLILGTVTFSEYKIENGNVTYKGYNHRNGKFITEDKNLNGSVDLKTFKELTLFYASDKNNVYYKGEIVEGADPKNFEVIRMDFGKDGKYMYYGKYRLDIDPLGFSFLGRTSNESITQVRINPTQYVKNYNSVYYMSVDSEYDKVEFLKKLDDADSKSFESWSASLGKDKNNVYYNGKKVSYIDVKTYDGNGYGYSKDKNNHYYIIKKIENADYKSFKAYKSGDFNYSHNYAKDKYHVFYNGEIIEGADPKSFKILKNDFGKDKTGYYYKEQWLRGVKNEEIENLINSAWSKKTVVPGYDYTKNKDFNE